MMDQDHMRVNSCWGRVQARGLAVKMPHPEAGEVPLVASPIRLSKTPVEYRRAPPWWGNTRMRSWLIWGWMRQALRGCGSGGWCRAPALSWVVLAPNAMKRRQDTDWWQQ